MAEIRVKDRQFFIALLILSLILFVSAAAPLLAPFDPKAIDMQNRLAPPSHQHLLGTDTLGRDLLSRILWGGRASILLSVLASSLTMMIGLLLGMIAGYRGGRIDSVVLVLTSLFQGIPGMSLMIAIAGALGPGIHSLLLSLVIISWPTFSRIVRGEVMRIKEEPFVEGIHALGGGGVFILFKQILPNIAGTVIVLFTTRVGFGILATSSLSFLGLGVQPPTPDWGVMIRDAMFYFREQPLLILAPGTILSLTSLCVNLIGDGLRDIFDVRTQSAMSRI